MKNFSVLISVLLSHFAFAQLTPIVDSIPMRDGKKLAADIYLSPNSGTAPTILVQTPYNRLWYRLTGVPFYGTNLSVSPYNFVFVDWRCFYGSINACVAGLDRGEDGYDVVEWIAAQPWSDGQVAGYGASALGVIQFQTAKEQPPALKCIVPIVSNPTTLYQDYFYGGVYREEYVNQLDALGYGLSQTLLANPFYSFYWQLVESGTYYPSAIEVPALMIGGWYDHNTEGQLDFFNGIRTSSPLAVRDQHRLVMGPWTHKDVGAANQGALQYPAAAGWSDSLALMFFDFHLRGISNGWNSTPYVQYFQMGDDTWHSSPTWPPQGVNTLDLFLHPGGTMDNNAPQNSTGDAGYAYDPHDPSPTVGGPTLSNALPEGPYDLAPQVESRNDMLIFTTAVLGQDVLMKGNSTVTLYVSSDRPDTDFAIRLTDVYPDGRSMLVVDGIRRMRFRNGFSAGDTASMIPGTVYPVVISLPTTAITFKAGHRIRIDISSSNYPRFDRNLNNGGAMYTAGDTLVANNTVYFNSQYPSHASFQLVDFAGAVNNQQAASPAFSIYPNPSNGESVLAFAVSSPADVTAELIDLSGRTVWSRKESCSGEQRWQLPDDLSAGTYFVRLIIPGNLPATSMFLQLR
jgi:predicted acyl esterase